MKVCKNFGENITEIINENERVLAKRKLLQLFWQKMARFLRLLAELIIRKVNLIERYRQKGKLVQHLNFVYLAALKWFEVK